jgi:hypothetical protein
MESYDRPYSFAAAFNAYNIPILPGPIMERRIKMFVKFLHKRFSKPILILCIVLLLSALTTAIVLAQDGTGSTEGSDQSARGVNTQNYFPVQGRLTDAGGNPLTGTYTMIFRLYDVLTGGTELCSDTNSVTVTNGLFNSEVWGNCQDDITGQQLYLGIQVGSDAEMAPRQPIFAVPYAWSLRPGAAIIGAIASGPVVHIENSATAGRGLRVYATDTTSVNYGIVGASTSPNGYGGFFYNNAAGIGLWGYSNATAKPAIFGCVNADSASCDAGTNPAGVKGASNAGDGVMGLTSDINFRGVYAANTGAGIAIAAASNSVDATSHTRPTLYLLQSNSAGDFVVGVGSYYGTRYWRVDRTGKGFFNGDVQASGADFAEQIAVKGDEAIYEPGDVMVISPDVDRVVELSTEAYSTAVIGVYSTKPALLAGAPDTDDPLKGIPVAVVGIVSCKVSAENGPIQRGDLLVTASKSGYAMRAGANPPQGTVLGKAMQALESGTGTILILVTLQ